MWKTYLLMYTAKVSYHNGTFLPLEKILIKRVVLAFKVWERLWIYKKKNPNYWSLKDTGTSSKLRFVYTGNYGQNIWNKIKQNWAETENPDNCFCIIFGCYYKSLISGSKTGD